MSQTFHHLEPRAFPRLLSLVIPMYNEQEMLPILRARLKELQASLPCATELVIVNDGSSDATLSLLLDWAKVDRSVKVIGLARNFGHQPAVTAGMDMARGEAIVVMDADLQDPPEVIQQMLVEYRKGYDVVNAQRAQREGETIFKRATAWGFYRFMNRFVHRDLPPDTGDFRLISRAVLEALKSMRETHRFIRGMVAWSGFAQTSVKFSRPPRAAGETKYSLSKMIKFAWTAACSFSTAPLRLGLFFGSIVGLFGFGVGLWAVITKMFGYTERGWTSLMAVVCLVGGAILFGLGVLGEYIGRIFEEVKGRPLYVVSKQYNLHDDSDEEYQRAAMRDVPLPSRDPQPPAQKPDSPFISQ